MPWGITEHINHLQKLLIPGVIGNYNSFEVTEIFSLHKDRPGQITNFMSLLVAEPSDPPVGPTTKPDILNGKKRIELRETPWKFGIARYRVSTQQVLQSLQNFSTTGEWKPGSSALKVGALTPIPPQFVPADTALPHPWNGVLKNNFWEGSHVLELFDGLKTDVKFLLDEPKLLKQLAADLRPFVKMSIDGLSDRLGNVLIQLPVTVVTTKVSSSQNGDFLVQPIWHNATLARQLRVSCEKYEDTTVEGYGSEDVTGSLANFPLHSPGGGARYVLWDDQNQLVLGASAQTSFITSISMNVHAIGESIKTRDFYSPLPNGTLEPVAVPLIEERKPNVIGKPTANPQKPWRDNRVFRDSLKNIGERREFVQYGGKAGPDTKRAFDDIHWLLQQHGQRGAWLWDPFLNAKDVVATLFYCPHTGADLRALTAGEEPKATNGKEPNSDEQQSAVQIKPSFKDKQQEIFRNAKGNCQDLHLEFRIREGSAGWSFHDRFLIFPSDTGPAAAWSLGTSVNSLGQKHHILQKVADGELIRQAFLDLWDELSGSDYLVWRTP